MTTFEELKKLIQKTFEIDPSTLKPDAPLPEYGLDSLSLAELMFVVEEHFGIEFPEHRQDVTTLSALADLVDELRATQAA
jgi:acyl carrier protein